MSPRQMTSTAVLTALLCLLGPLTLPIGPIPLSLVTAALMLLALLLGPGRAVRCCGLYLLLGAVGLPVFSGFQGGWSALLGPTGGFLLGYLPLTAIAGCICIRTSRRALHAAAFLAGTGVLYMLGTAWYCLQAGVALPSAMAVCVLPFLPGDGLKIAAVALLGRDVRTRIQPTGLLR